MASYQQDSDGPLTLPSFNGVSAFNEKVLRDQVTNPLRDVEQPATQGVPYGFSPRKQQQDLQNLSPAEQQQELQNLGPQTQPQNPQTINTLMRDQLTRMQEQQPTQLPPMLSGSGLGQQKAEQQGLGALGGGQQNLNLGQVGLTFNPSGQGGGQGKGYTGWSFAEGGAVNQQLIPFQPTYSQGIGSLQPYQAPVMPPMEASPQNNMQYAPTTKYSIQPRQTTPPVGTMPPPDFKIQPFPTQPTQPTQPVSNSTSAIQYDPVTQSYSVNPSYAAPPPPAPEVEVNTGNEGGSDYARGGAVNQGQGLASLGRGQDSMLVHMTPGEVQGLQQLAMKHGGSLTTNPQTGLPEAGILSSLLPMALGFALGPAGFGVMSSLGAAATVGGIGALATGSLSKGLMYGLGAYGGSELGAGLAASAPAAVPGAVPSIPGALNSSTPLLSGAGTDAIQPIANMQSTDFVNLGNSASAIPPPPLLPPQGIVDLANSAGPRMIPAEYSGNFDKAYAGTKEVVSSPTNALNFAKSNFKNIGMALAPAIPDLMKQNTLNVEGAKPSQFPYKQYSFSQEVNPNFGQPGQPYYLNQGYTAAAKGGAIGDTSGIMSTPRPFQKMSTASLLAMARGKNKSSNTAKQELAARQSAGEDVTPQINVASGGLMNFAGNDYAAGGKLLRGPGDGMSDSIPAVIKGKNPQRAALADGEFVIPADVVSHLGNGSTEAGSKHLYSMMNRVRKARTGNPKQGKQINAARFMPA